MPLGPGETGSGSAQRSGDGLLPVTNRGSWRARACVRNEFSEVPLNEERHLY